ncbi:MAG TPA: glycosyltransferase family 1 protein [Chloroflexota bacterium]|nr:glycosyltransferase family 1 protein [Chloroflexota bacterium]
MARIGINAQLLSFSRSYRNAGSSAYIYQLLRHLPAIPSPHRYIVFTNADRRELRVGDERGFHLVRSRLSTERPARRILWEQLALPALIARERLDLVHGTLNVLPLTRRTPGVVTIHDVSFLLFPERFLPAKRRYLTTMTRLSARGARFVAASSENTRRDVIQLLGVPEERVRVIPLGVDDRLREPVDPETIAAFRIAHDLPEHFYLYIGSLEPRKNLVRLVEAYGLARQAGVDWPLVLAGGKGWLYEEIFTRIQELGLEPHIRLPGYVLYEDLPLWYNAASVFVYPSLYEGFGLPVAEAMTCGCPVITSTASSLPEVAGDAAILVDPEEVEELRDGLVRLAGSPTLRADLARLGRERATRFDWRGTVAQMVSLYSEALEA